MIAPTTRPTAEYLSHVLCAQCGLPVSRMNPRIPGAVAGGMCRRCSGRKNAQGERERVYTYERRIAPDDQ
jgi:hypothetical protein